MLRNGKTRKTNYYEELRDCHIVKLLCYITQIYKASLVIRKLTVKRGFIATTCLIIFFFTIKGIWR